MQRLRKQSRRRAVLTAATIAVLCTSTAKAADLYWDANGATAGTGGTGNWLTPSNVSNWRTGGTGGALGTWSDGNNAIFPSSVGTVTVDGAVSATGLRFDISAYTVTGANGWWDCTYTEGGAHGLCSGAEPLTW